MNLLGKSHSASSDQHIYHSTMPCKYIAIRVIKTTKLSVPIALTSLFELMPQCIFPEASVLISLSGADEFMASALVSAIPYILLSAGAVIK